MRHRLIAILASCLLAATAVLGLLAVPARARTLQQPVTLTETASGGRILLHFAEKSTPLAPELLALPKVARRQAIVESLQTTAAASQQRLLQDLQRLSAAGDVTTYRSLWIINAIAVEGKPDALNMLAHHPDVAYTTPDESHSYFAEWLQSGSPTTAPLPNHGIDQIRARHVWDGLGIDGQGVTIAIVDTGVDWQHPDLLRSYRGNLGNGRFDHTTSWFHSSIPTATVPFDPHGHGTHVAGTAVGHNNIGVAPGANWMAVAIADENGIAYDSDIHAAFQWLLAPNGDPAAAPDIASNSWGGAPERTEFQPDIELLHAAGIITVFAAGNTGPGAGTVNAPAGFEGTVAVGAIDELDEIAWFSSRGPSPHTAEPKPLLAAPGTAVFSTLPGSTYGRYSGTSMATPHVAGVVALMLAAQPDLDRAAVIEQLAATAVATDPPHPNFTTGYGKVDAFAAVAPSVRTGRLKISVSHAGQALPFAPVVIQSNSGSQLPFTADGAGLLTLDLKPGRYQVRVAPFGYVTFNTAMLEVRAGAATAVTAALTPLPSGQITGQITAADAAPLRATLSILGTQVEVITDNDGRFALSLPAGQYQLQARATGQRVETRNVHVAAGKETAVTIALRNGPRIHWLTAAAIAMRAAMRSTSKRSPTPSLRSTRFQSRRHL